jgi:hypothetical protein
MPFKGIFIHLKSNTLKNLKNLSVFIYALLVMGLITMVSCTKTGPAGATGATGATGAVGATGAAGPDSVQYSPWITLVTEGRTLDFYGDSIYVDTIAAPGITSSILNSGAVIGYLYANTFVNPGDSSIINVDNPNLVEIVQTPEVGKIILYWSPNSQDYTGYQYRYVIIPGNIETTSTSGSGPTSYNPGQLKTMTYRDLDGILKMRTSGNLVPLPFRP